MARSLLASLAALFLAPAAFAGPGDIEVCKVIPTSDVEAATGIRSISQQATYRQCSWRTAAPDVWVDVKAFKRARQSVSGTASFEQMKKMGFKGDITDDTPELWCSRLVAPEAMGGMPVIDCQALTQGHYFEVMLNGRDMTREKAKALVAKVANRLP